jgi:RND family efflux transporter MFP subunit
MRTRTLGAAWSLLFTIASAVWAQTQDAPTASARVEAVPLELISSERYQIPVVLEPSRRVAIVAIDDGVVRGLSVPVGGSVREGQEVAQLDREAALARLEIAKAAVAEMEAAVQEAKEAKKSRAVVAQAEARLAAVKARVKLAQLELDRCTLRAPFAGRVLALPVSAGQYVAKGTTLAELAEVSSLRALLPVDRTAVKVGSNLEIQVEGQPVPAKVQAILPLTDPFAPLRELAAPLAAAWVVVSNSNGALEPGQRCVSPYLPKGSLATVPARAVREDENGGSSLQVIRNEFVTDVPVRVLGRVEGERVQVAGALRANDAVIVSSSVPLVAGTLIRFSGGNSGLEAQAPRPDQAGSVAGLTPPPGVAPIGAVGPGARNPARSTPRPPASRPASKPTNRPPAGAVPF